MIWDKERMGMGYYARQQHELLLIATRGAVPVPDPGNRPPSVIRARRDNEHSAKPAEFYDIIERMYPDLPKIELFARDPRQSSLARRALIAITRHDLGEEGGPWRDWWADNEKRHRVEWLIDAIERTDLPLRNPAPEDLRQLAARHPEHAPPEGSFLYSPLAWKMWWATITGAGARVRVSTAPPLGRPKTNPSTP